MTGNRSVTELFSKSFPDLLGTYRSLSEESQAPRENFGEVSTERASASDNLYMLVLVAHLAFWFWVFWRLSSYVVSTPGLPVWFVMVVYFILFKLPLGALLAFLVMYFFENQGQYFSNSGLPAGYPAFVPQKQAWDYYMK